MSLKNTHWERRALREVLQKSERLYFLGIGGVHMAALAELSLLAGKRVAGYDAHEGARVERLRGLGVPVITGDEESDLRDGDAVVFTLAIGAGDRILCRARELGVPLISRADYLGYVMQDYRHRIGVAGSHGKSTVTAMLAAILEEAGEAPTVLCGAEMRGVGGTFLAGGNTHLVYEACEYRRSFLCTSPTVAVVLNAEMDHADYFKSLGDVKRAFLQFATLPPREGLTVYNADDENLRHLSKKVANGVTFGYSATADYRATEPVTEGDTTRFFVLHREQPLAELRLHLYGVHQVFNALAAFAVADTLGIPPKSIAASLSAFRGAKRRMEYKGHISGASFFDDYAHHPTEMAASLAAARQMAANGRVFAVFQSHTYSRTKAFFADFARVLQGADRVVLADIYAAREAPIEGVDAKSLAGAVGERAVYLPTFGEMAALVRREVREGDVVLVMGAGDIDRIFLEFFPKHFTL